MLISTVPCSVCAISYFESTSPFPDALRTPEERLPSGVAKKEFGRMILEKNSSMEDRTNVQSTPLATARAGEAWRRNM